MDGAGRGRIALLAGLGIALVVALTWHANPEIAAGPPEADQREEVPPQAVPTLVTTPDSGAGGRGDDEADPLDAIRAVLLRVDTRIAQMRRIATRPALRENVALREAVDVLERAAGCVALSAHHALARYRVQRDQVHVHAPEVGPVNVPTGTGRAWRWVGITAGAEVGARGAALTRKALLHESAVATAQAELDGTGAFLRWAEASMGRDGTPASKEFLSAGESAVDDLQGLLDVVQAHLAKVAGIAAEGGVVEPGRAAGSGR